jgi:hypothetical protein
MRFDTPPEWVNQSDETRMWAQAETHGKKTTKVDMPAFSFTEKKLTPKAARDTAEQQFIDSVTQAMKTIEFAFNQVNSVPHPTMAYQSRFRHKDLIDLLGRVCRCFNPAIPFAYSPLVAVDNRCKPRLSLSDVHICVECGGPARIQYQNEWFCEDCTPLQSPYKQTERRRELVRELEDKEAEARKLKDAIEAVAEKLKPQPDPPPKPKPVYQPHPNPEVTFPAITTYQDRLKAYHDKLKEQQPSPVFRPKEHQ